MRNKVEIKDKLNAIQKLAVTGFLFGADNYGEDVIGVSDELSYSKFTKHYSLTVFLRESNTHTSTSGIGFYVNPNKTLMIYSSREVITVGITPVIERLLETAIIENF